jgi:formylglycine-generating enzyme required for sulfatase activity
LLHFWKLSAPGSAERTYLRWSAVVASIIALIVALVIGTAAESAWWAQQHNFPPAYILHKPRWMLGYAPEPKLEEIPPGQFTMGCKVGRDDIDGTCWGEEMPAREVTISQPFLMGRHEVTFLEYDAFVWHMKREGIKKPDGKEWDYPPDESWGRLYRPVINVGWGDARVYAQWLGEKTGRTCRLPSEAEWEYAARGRTGKKYGVPAPEGSHDIAGKGLANCYGCGSVWDGKKTAPVGHFPANRFGLYDLSGNVEEWVEDTYQPYPEGPTGPEALKGEGRNGRVLRGGSWDDNLVVARASARNFDHPGFRVSDVGFRVLCESPIE